jgi:hypothetical protein
VRKDFTENGCFVHEFEQLSVRLILISVTLLLKLIKEIR